MKEETQTEIERIIGNRLHEEHLFQSGSKGMASFAKMATLVDELNPDEFRTFLLPKINALLEKQVSCVSCYVKLCCFAELYSHRRHSD